MLHVVYAFQSSNAYTNNGRQQRLSVCVVVTTKYVRSEQLRETGARFFQLKYAERKYCNALNSEAISRNSHVAGTSCSAEKVAVVIKTMSAIMSSGNISAKNVPRMISRIASAVHLECI